MNKNNQLKVAAELGMKFDEAMDLFSDETLSTMRMENVVGGAGEMDTNILYCDMKTTNCACPHASKCKCNPNEFCEKGVICDFTIPLPDIPTIPVPSLAIPKD